MTEDTRTTQDLVQEQLRITSDLSVLNGEHHRLLQQLGAASITQQMIEDDSAATTLEALRLAQTDVDAARAASEACEERIAALEKRLDAVIHELLARP